MANHEFGTASMEQAILSALKRGKIALLVGVTGSGKTTLANRVLKKHKVKLVDEVFGEKLNQAIERLVSSKEAALVLVQSYEDVSDYLLKDEQLVNFNLSLVPPRSRVESEATPVPRRLMLPKNRVVHITTPVPF